MSVSDRKNKDNFRLIIYIIVGVTIIQFYQYVSKRFLPTNEVVSNVVAKPPLQKVSIIDVRDALFREPNFGLEAATVDMNNSTTTNLLGVGKNNPFESLFAK